MRKLVIVGLGIVFALGLCSLSPAAETGTAKTVTGTVEDSFCYFTMGAHGPDHKKCAMGCVKKGIPASLVEKGTGKVYVLLPPKDAQPLPDALVDHMEDEVTVAGKTYASGGVDFLTVESVK